MRPVGVGRPRSGWRCAVSMPATGTVVWMPRTASGAVRWSCLERSREGRDAMWCDLGRKGMLRVIGLMSGTSMDGVDAVLAEIDGPADQPSIRQVAFLTMPYPDDLRREIRAVASG